MTSDQESGRRAVGSSPGTDADSLSLVYLQGSPDAVVVVDDDGLITFVNDRTEKMFGYDRAGQLIGEAVEKLVPDHVAAVHRAHRAGYRTAPAVRAMGEAGVELFGRRSDATTFPVEISLSPIETTGGHHVMACIRDITERVRLEADARRVGDALDAVHEAVFMFEPDSLRFVYVNDGAVEQVGYSRAELLGGMTPLDLKPEFTPESFRVLVDRLVTEERDSLTFTTLHRRKDGSELAVEVVLQLPDTGGRHEEVLVALARDVSERHAAQRRSRADHVTLRVEDDGVGIPDDRLVGFGIPNIGSRAEELAGELSIGAGADGGTDLVWRVPAR